MFPEILAYHSRSARLIRFEKSRHGWDVPFYKTDWIIQRNRELVKLANDMGVFWLNCKSPWDY